MSTDYAALYADHDVMANHWWWRPGWKVGTRFYAWHITLDGQDELHALADKYAAALADVPTLDLVPRQWLHITLQGLGHVEEVEDARRDAAVEAVRARLADVAPITSTYVRAHVFKALALPPDNPQAFTDLRATSEQASPTPGATAPRTPTASEPTPASSTPTATVTASRSLHPRHRRPGSSYRHHQQRLADPHAPRPPHVRVETVESLRLSLA